MRGTHIATPQGGVCIEDFRIGDLVLTASGESRPVRWLGHSEVDCARWPDPSALWPIRIQAGAFAEGGVLNASQAFEIRDAVLADADSGSFRRLDLSPVVHRQAERLLLHVDSVPLRTLDALHVALALQGSAAYVVTYDARMRAAALHAGLKAVDL